MHGENCDWDSVDAIMIYFNITNIFITVYYFSNIPFFHAVPYIYVLFPRVD